VDSTAKIRQDSKGGTESSGALEQLSWEQTGLGEGNKRTGNRQDMKRGTRELGTERIEGVEHFTYK
jgi:hypothetical protein